jgi:Zn ribbon nucleic-acid-binding protein
VGYATFLSVGKSEELRSCVCCGHATRKTDELGRLQCYVPRVAGLSSVIQTFEILFRSDS